MKKKIISALLCVAMTASLVVGCGSKSDDKKESSDGKTTLTFWCHENEPWVKSYKKVAEKFEKENPDYKVVVKDYPYKVYNDKIQTALTSKTAGPDIIAVWGGNAPAFIESDSLSEVPESLAKELDEDYLAPTTGIYKKEGTYYGVPMEFNLEYGGMIVNKKLFDKAGIAYPKTWDEFIDVLDQIKEAGEQPLLMTYKDAWTSLCPWNSMAPDLAPTTFNDDRKAGKTTFVGTHEEIVEKYLKLLDYAQDDFMGLTYDDGNKAFANGEAAMIVNGNWAINQYLNSNSDLKVNMFAFPASNDEAQNYVTSGVDVLLGVCKDSANEEMAKEFVSFMLEPENAKMYIEDQFAFSAVKGVEQENETVAGVKEDIANGKVANFPDHYYPSGFDLSALISEMCLNYTNGMDNEENMNQFLAQCDEKYDIANVD